MERRRFSPATHEYTHADLSSLSSSQSDALSSIHSSDWPKGGYIQVGEGRGKEWRMSPPQVVDPCTQFGQSFCSTDFTLRGTDQL